MSALSIVEQLIGYAQYFSLLVNINGISWPDEMRVSVDYIQVVNLDIDFFRHVFPGVSKDPRTQFIMVAIALPMLFVFLGLLALLAKRVVIWFFALLTGTTLLVAGIISKIISSVDVGLDVDDDMAYVLIGVGCGLLLACLVAYVIERKFLSNTPVEEINASTRQELMNAQTAKLDVMVCVERLVFMLIFGILGILLSGVAVTDLLGSDRYVSTSSVGALTKGIGYALLALAGLLLIWLILGLFLAGRKVQWKIARFCRDNFMKILLVAMSLIYIPVATSAVLMFNCSSFTCPDHQRLADDGSFVAINGNEYCQTCVVSYLSTCNANIRERACKSTDVRLEMDRTISCQALREFFWPAAGIVIVNFVLGVPFIFYRLVSAATRTLHELFPRAGLPPDASDFDTWQFIANNTKDVVTFLYKSFEYPFRFWRILMTFQKLAIVVTGVYIIRSGGVPPEGISIFCALGIHVVMFVALLRTRPFILEIEDYLSFTVAFCLSLTAVIGILAQQEISIPTWASWIVCMLAIILPVTAIIIGVVVEYRAAQEQKKKAEANPNGAISVVAEDSEEEGDEFGAVAPSPKAEKDTGKNGSGNDSKPSTEKKAGAKKSAGASSTKPSAKSVAAAEADALKKEKAALKENRAFVDMKCNNASLAVFKRYLFVSGILGFIALALAFMGVLAAGRDGVVHPFPSTSTRDTELAGYASFQEFTDRCCCVEYQNKAPNRYPIVEKWICENGKVKERVRSEREMDSDGKTVVRTTTGFAIRRICSSTFDSGCRVDVANDDTVSLTCPGGVPQENQRFW